MWAEVRTVVKFPFKQLKDHFANAVGVEENVLLIFLLIEQFFDFIGTLWVGEVVVLGWKKSFSMNLDVVAIIGLGCWTKVDDFWSAAGGDHDVSWLEVPMADAAIA